MAGYLLDRSLIVTVTKNKEIKKNWIESQRPIECQRSNMCIFGVLPEEEKDIEAERKTL